MNLFQALLETLTYSYMLGDNDEPIEGERLIEITISDGIFQSSVTIAVDVVALNNHPPQIIFSGSSNITFTEGETQPIPLGNLLAPIISDADSNTIFLMQSAVVELLHATDGEQEELNSDIDSALGISVNRKPLPLYKCYLLIFPSLQVLTTC